jgi:hypothetical protein
MPPGFTPSYPESLVWRKAEKNPFSNSGKVKDLCGYGAEKPIERRLSR